MPGLSIGIGRSLLMLLMGLTLIASFAAPSTAWAQDETADDAVEAVEDAAEDVEEGSEEAAEEEAYSYDWETSEISEEMFTVNNLWIMIAGMLVFIMHLGFAMVESGLTRAKNTVNILFKNVMVVMLGIVTYGVCGWMIMYPGEWIVGDVFAFAFGIGGGGGFYDAGYDYAGLTPEYNPGYTVWTDFFFPGHVRCDLLHDRFGCSCLAASNCFLSSSSARSSLPLPTALSAHGNGVVAGSTALRQMKMLPVPFGLPEFADFAGSTLVHAVVGAGALAGALLLGPRLGKYAKDGTLQPIPGHSMPLATIGVFLLWFGWFGFNGGSELSAFGPGVLTSSSPRPSQHVVVV